MDEEQQQEKKTRRRLVDMFPDVEVGPREKAPEGLIDAAQVSARTGFGMRQVQNWHARGVLTPRYIIGTVSAEGTKSGRSGLYHPDDVAAAVQRPMDPGNRAKLGTVEQRQDRIQAEIDAEVEAGRKDKPLTSGGPLPVLQLGTMPMKQAVKEVADWMLAGINRNRNLSGQFDPVAGSRGGTTEDFRLPSGEINPDLL